jgi:hypothetical protein
MGIVMLTWLIRYGHVLGGGIWVGGYALLAIVIIPVMARQANAGLLPVAINTVRLVSFAGTATILFGLALIARTRGFAALVGGGEWGGIVVFCIGIAVVLLGMGDSGLRPALRHLAETGDAGRARRLAWIGFILTIIAIGLMTRALYAGS